jgi:hypothetical protein
LILPTFDTLCKLAKDKNANGLRELKGHILSDLYDGFYPVTIMAREGLAEEINFLINCFPKRNNSFLGDFLMQ